MIFSNVSIGKKWSLTARDWAQGLVMAVYGAVGGQLWAIAVDWAANDKLEAFDKHGLILAAKGAAIAAGSYLFKRFTQKPDIIIPNPPKETVQALKENSQAIAAVNTPGQTISQTK